MHSIIVITGPTASGKSALALQIAEKLGSEIISADSRQIYRGLPIVTAAPTAAEMARVRHHLVGTLPLDAYYSASEFESDALRIIADMHRRGMTPVVCGGSMMYVDALCRGLDELPTVSEAVRRGLAQEWRERGDAWLVAELERVDPEYFARVDRQNLKRVFHAVEITREAGVPYSSLLGQRRVERPFRILKYAVEQSREEMFARINTRVLQMIEAGAVEEVRSVMHLRHLNSLNTVGVKELLEYLDGRWTLDEAVARLQKNTRVYAKKQLTWLKRDKDIVWKSRESLPDDIFVALRNS